MADDREQSLLRVLSRFLFLSHPDLTRFQLNGLADPGVTQIKGGHTGCNASTRVILVLFYQSETWLLCKSGIFKVIHVYFYGAEKAVNAPF